MMNFNALTALLDRLPQEAGIPGADCVVYHHRKEVYRHQSGYSDIAAKKPVETDVLYNVYSASKLVTCVAALKLYEQGYFLLTDPLYEYIPEFKTMKIKENGFVSQAKNDIVIRDLFTMTAGFSYDIKSPSLLAVKKETEQRCPTLEVVRALAKEPLLFEPGSRWYYSLCHDVLGGLVEVVSGKTLEEYCRENIFEPLHMNDTSYFMDEDKEKRLAPMYLFNEEKEVAEPISNHNIFRFGSEYASGGAGIVSSVSDFIKLADCLCAGGKTITGEHILGGNTIDLMRKNHLHSDGIREFGWNHMPGYGYGLGVRTMVDPVAGGSNGPVGEFGWGGAAGAYVLIDPDNELAVCYAQHMLTSKEEYIHRRIRNTVYGCL
ncbi:MAG: beta-lactamase family protein [Ruminococcaceae bacterium]|nr:beta-lactamase family protein [Oscillospiraceae bacterium]